MIVYRTTTDRGITSFLLTMRAQFRSPAGLNFLVQVFAEFPSLHMTIIITKELLFTISNLNTRHLLDKTIVRPTHWRSPEFASKVSKTRYDHRCGLGVTSLLLTWRARVGPFSYLTFLLGFPSTTSKIVMEFWAAFVPGYLGNHISSKTINHQSTDGDGLWL